METPSRRLLAAIDVDRLAGGVLVSRGDAVLVDEGFGAADRANRVAVTPATTFQIASLSKQFAAAATTVLAEHGELSPDDPISRWFVRCPPDWRAITVHHLLTNTSGIGHWADYPEIDLYRPTTSDRLLETIFARPLKSRPGERWRYSSLGFVLLAHIVALTAGTQYASFLERAIFTPLGMATTAAGNAPARAGRRAVGYSAGEPVPSFELDTVSIGAGDVWSSTRDLARWKGALASGSLPTGESLAALVEPHASVGPQVAYGYGCFVGTMHGRRAVYHPGDNRGFRAFGAWLPDDDLFVAVLTNDDQTNAEANGTRLVAAVLRP